MSQHESGHAPHVATLIRREAATPRSDGGVSAGFPPQSGKPDLKVVGGYGTSVTVPRSALYDLGQLVKAMAPDHRNPHRFHEVKSEVLAAILDLATA